jgi:hypothetical protein
VNFTHRAAARRGLLRKRREEAALRSGTTVLGWSGFTLAQWDAFTLDEWDTFELNEQTGSVSFNTT